MERGTIFQYLLKCWRILRQWMMEFLRVGKDDPVKVYILLGQSNMLGMGNVEPDNKDGTLEYAVRQKKLYSYLVEDQSSSWTTSPRVRNVRVMGETMEVFHNEFLSVRGDTIGPEYGIGHYLEQSIDGSILLLKSCIGNRSLGWDLLPPGSPRYEYDGKIYAGYKDSPSSWDKGSPKPDPIDWYAGKQYDVDIANAKQVLKQLDYFYPNANKYQVEGFFWWQGDKDRYDEAYAALYERNLVRLIHQLRVTFQCPKAKFVMATLGQTDLKTEAGTEKMIMDAMLAVDGNAGNYPEFVGNVSTVYSHPLSEGGSSNGHYNGNAETYMNVGEAMGKAMVELSIASNNSSDDDKTEVLLGDNLEL